MKHGKKWIAGPVAAVLLLLGYWQAAGSGDSVGSPAGLTVTFLDVGQGDAAVIQCAGQTMLIDGGDNSAADTLVEDLEQLGVTTLDVVICTHPHADHCGGLDAAVRRFGCGTAYCSAVRYDSKSFADFASAVEEAGAEIETPPVDVPLSIGDGSWTVLGPRSYEVPQSWNDASIVVRLTYGDTAFLFAADAETAEETEILEAGADISCDVLKVGHHGSSTSTGYRWLYEAQPAYGVISCGADNSYGHPHEETLSKLSDADVTVLRTDQMGTITFYSDGETVAYTSRTQPSD